METFKFIQSSIFILIIISCLGCNKSTGPLGIKIDSIDTSKIYTGKIIIKSCPSNAIVQVNTDNIGEDWIFGNTYKNVIAISNCPDTIASNSSISFKIIVSENWSDCATHKACLDDLIISLPSKIYCAKNITTLKK